MTVAVYCSAKDAIPEAYKVLGDALGKWLGEAGHNLVYGGATGGLMTRVSEAFKCHKREQQQLIGVIPHRIIAAGRKAEGCDRLIEVSDMAERKRTMREVADCFIVLPGSYGTLDELMDVVASGTVGEHHKPVYIINYNGFYNELQALASHMRQLQFLPKEEAYRPQWVENIEQLKQYL